MCAGGSKSFDWRLWISLKLVKFFNIFCYRKTEEDVNNFHEVFMNNTMLYNMYGGLIPSGRSLYLPWNESQASIPRNGVVYQERPGFLPHVIDELNITRNFRIHAGLMSSVTLMPSPGEQFWLKINCFNNRLKRMKAKLSIQVSVTVLLSAVSAHRIIIIIRNSPSAHSLKKSLQASSNCRRALTCKNDPSTCNLYWEGRGKMSLLVPVLPKYNSSVFSVINRRL